MYLPNVHSSEKNVLGHPCLVKYICGTCWKKDKKQFRHPESSTACPYKARLSRQENVSAAEISHGLDMNTSASNIRIVTVADQSSVSQNVLASSVSTGVQNTSISLSYYSIPDFILLNGLIFLSGKYNFEGCRISLQTHLNIDYFKFMLFD